MKRVVFDRKVKGESKGYPYTGINYKTETIILFKRKNTGTVLYHKDKQKIGEHKRSWNECAFMVCPHIVCFKNV